MTMPRPRDLMRGFLAIALLTCFMVALFWLMEQVVPAENVDLVTYMLGQLSMLTGGAMVYYFGTSKSSADKNEIIRDRDGPSHIDANGNALPIRHARPAPDPEILDLGGAEYPDDEARNR